MNTSRFARIVAWWYPRSIRGEIAWFVDQRRGEARFAGIAGRARLIVHLMRDSFENVPRVRVRDLSDRADLANEAMPPREDRAATLVHDVRTAFRALVHRPGFTATIAVTLMLGIGATTAIFSIVDAVLLRPLPYAHPEQLTMIWGTMPNRGGGMLMPIPAVDELGRRSKVFAAIGMARAQSVNLTGTDKPDRLTGGFVSASTFRLFAVPIARGRSFTDEDTRLGAGNAVAIISDNTWRTRYGSDPAILGKTILLNGRPHTVIGVIAPGFDIPLGPTDVWLPITSAPSAAWFTPGNATVWSFGRLRPGATVAQGQSELSTIAEQLGREQPLWAGTGVSVSGLQDYVVGPVRPTLLIILGAVAVVLLIGCANVANLQLARAAGRAREMSVRAALGASRWRLIRQLLTESLLLALLGGAGGVVLAYLGTETLAAAIPSSVALRGAGIDAKVLAFSLLITVVTGMAFGLAPALHASRADIGEALRARTGEAAPRRFDLRSVFVVTQLALCIVLLVGAGLFARTVYALQHVPTGFRTDHLLTAEFRLPAVKYRTPQQIQRFMDDALAALRAVPGTRSVAMVGAVPLGGNWGGVSYVAQGQPAPTNGNTAPAAQLNAVSDGFFRTMEMPLVAGRDFTTTDVATSPPVVIVNQRLAELNWPGESAIGKHVRLIGPPDVDAEVIGVTGNLQQRFLNDPPTPQIYQPFTQANGIFNSVVMRTIGDPELMTPALRNAIWSVDPDQPVWKIRSMDRLLGMQTASSRFTMILTGAFALLALLLATIGVYGVMAFTVTQRTREVGIRMALGAGRSQVVRMVVGRGVRVVAVAIAVGTGVSIWASHFVQHQLYGVAPADPLTLIAVTATLAAIALLASWLPARRAARVDPVIALRNE